MAQRPWGFWTENKLDMLSGYLPAFTQASARATATVYLDLFAGQDENTMRETGHAIRGSLQRALETRPPFAVVRGFELRTERARSLEAAYRQQHPGRDVVIHAGDVHQALPSALAELHRYRWAPTFAFVDPDGIEARWELLQALADHRAGDKKVELFLLLASSQIGRVVNGALDTEHRARAEGQITALFGCDQWRPILQARQGGRLDAEQARDELTNLMRWRLEKDLGYAYTHTLRLTNTGGVPLYDMVFATDHPAGDRIMKSVYNTAAARFPGMRRQARARRRDREEEATGLNALFTRTDLLDDKPLSRNEIYQHTPPDPPYGPQRLRASPPSGIPISKLVS